MDTEIDVNSPDFDIRYMVASDAPVLKKWLIDPQIFECLPTSEEKEGEMALKIWEGFSKYNCCLTATWKNEPCGMGIVYLMPYRKVAHRCLAQLIVAPQFQRKGVGRAIVKNLKHLAQNYFRLEWIQMEVIDGCPIVDLLKACDFTEFARQEKYFKRGDSYSARILFECDLRDAGKR